MPHTAHSTYSNQRMIDVAQWAKTKAEHVLFVYGEFDPWSAGAYPRVSQAADFHWFLVPAGNHSSKIFKLPEAQKNQALAIVSKWMGKRNVLSSLPPGEVSLDDIELRARKSRRVRP
jgi:hypothetical protein